MKKTMVLFAILFTASANAMERISVAPNISLNYVDGTNFDLSSSREEDPNPKFDFGVGVDLVFDVNKNIKWFTGISYQRFLANTSSKGYKIEMKGAYLDVPIGAQVYINEIIYFPVSLNALIDIGTKNKFSLCSVGCVKRSDKVESFVLAANIGIGANLDKFLINLKYMVTLTNVGDDRGDFRGIRLGLGYMI